MRCCCSGSIWDIEILFYMCFMLFFKCFKYSCFMSLFLFSWHHHHSLCFYVTSGVTQTRITTCHNINVSHDGGVNTMGLVNKKKKTWAPETEQKWMWECLQLISGYFAWTASKALWMLRSLLDLKAYIMIDGFDVNLLTWLWAETPAEWILLKLMEFKWFIWFEVYGTYILYSA